MRLEVGSYSLRGLPQGEGEGQGATETVGCVVAALRMSFTMPASRRVKFWLSLTVKVLEYIH